MAVRIRETKPIRLRSGRCACCEKQPARHDYYRDRVCGSCLDFLLTHDTKHVNRNRSR